jgi:hypothetical protein
VKNKKINSNEKNNNKGIIYHSIGFADNGNGKPIRQSDERKCGLVQPSEPRGNSGEQRKSRVVQRS